MAYVFELIRTSKGKVPELSEIEQDGLAVIMKTWSMSWTATSTRTGDGINRSFTDQIIKPQVAITEYTGITSHIRTSGELRIGFVNPSAFTKTNPEGHPTFAVKAHFRERCYTVALTTVCPRAEPSLR